MSLLNYNRKTILADAKLGRSNALISTSGCPCAESAFVANVLKNIGMPYAAGMHAKKNGDWTSEDWDLHAKEEDDKLFPLLMRVAEHLNDKEKIYLISEVDSLLREHELYVYPYIAKGENPPEVEILRHGAKEDLLVKKYANQLLILGHALDKCDVCKSYAWDMSLQKPVFNDGTFHHPSCGLARVKVAKVGGLDWSKSTELADSYASNNQSYSDSKADIEKKYGKVKAEYDEYKSKYDQYRDLYTKVTSTTIGEEYGDNWSGSIASDPTLSGLKKALDESAAAGEGARSKREGDFRSKMQAYGAFAGALAGPYGAAVVLAVYALGEAWMAFGKMFTKPISGNSESDKKAANEAATNLWNKWRVNPPTFAADYMTAASYASLSNHYIDYLDGTERNGPPCIDASSVDCKWREQWVAVNDSAIEMVADKESNLVRDASLAGLFPMRIEKWASTQFGGFGTGVTPGAKWGGKFDTGQKTKDGGSVQSSVLTLDQYLKNTEGLAAGIGIMVAAHTGKLFEPLIEAAVKSHRMHAENAGPGSDVSGWRLRAVFLDTMVASKNVPSRYGINVVATGISSISVATLGFVLFGPIGALAGVVPIAVGALVAKSK